MNDKSLQTKRSEMRGIWKSFEYLIKEKLVSIDNNARAMQAEMRTMGVPAYMIAEYLPQQFEILKNQVVQEQEARYSREEEEGA